MARTKNATVNPETEVPAKATRRTFTKEYKLSILEKADRCTGPGEIGRLLRQEGLYSSHLTCWRALRREGGLRALGRKRGPKQTRTAEQLENEKLRHEIERLRKKLAHAEKIITVQKTVGSAGDPAGRRGRCQRESLKSMLDELAPEVGVRAACDALGVAPSTGYRWLRPPVLGPRPPRPRPARALTESEREEVLEVLCSERFVDHAPTTVHAMLLDEDARYLCHPRTMYTAS